MVGARAGAAAAAHAASTGSGRGGTPALPRQEILDRADLQIAMSRDASVVRDADGLRRLSDTLAEAGSRPVGTRAGFEDAALTLTAQAVAVAAADRTESRGCHHRSDWPETDGAQARSTVVRLVDGHVKVDNSVVAA